jgi:hypothetical protein
VAPGLHATGASIPGLPLALIGHNAGLSWNGPPRERSIGRLQLLPGERRP